MLIVMFFTNYFNERIQNKFYKKSMTRDTKTMTQTALNEAFL